jgi:hypothetical protein
MAFHPEGLVVDLVGIEEPSRGRNCEVHDCCGLVLELDMVVRFRAIQIAVEGKEESAIAVYWVTDGIDRCLVAFLRRHLVKSKEEYDGKLAQVSCARFLFKRSKRPEFQIVGNGRAY